MKKPTWRTATTKEIELFVDVIPELEWEDFEEVTPGRWLPIPESEEKILALRDVVDVRLAEIDAYIEDEQRKIQMLGEKWVRLPLKQ